MGLSQVERETIILFNEGESDAEIYTFNEKLKRRLASAAAKHPEIYHLKSTDQHGAATYVFPKRWLTVLFREPSSNEQREKRSEWMKSINQQRGKSKKTSV